MLDYFALIVLIVLIGVVVAAWIMLAMMPGQIAKKRGHPQAEAINVMGWWGALTMGILAPIAWVWAFTNPDATLKGQPKPDSDLSRRLVPAEPEGEAVSPEAKPDPESDEEVTS